MRSFYLKPVLILMALGFTAIALSSCKKEEKEPVLEPTVRLNKAEASLIVGESILLMPTFMPANENPSTGYEWKASNPGIVDLTVNPDFSIKVTAKGVGETKIFVQTTSGKEVASCDVVIEEEPDPQVSFNIGDRTIIEEEEITLVASFVPAVNNPASKFEWKVADKQVVELTVNPDFSAKVTGLAVGETSVSLVKKSGGAVLGTVAFTVEAKLPVGTLLRPVQISFGKLDNVPSSWNVFTQALGTNVGSSLPDLNDQEGNKTGVSMKLVERFNGMNENGPAQTETDLNMPSSVSLSSLFGNNGNEFGGMVIRQSVVKFAALNPDFEYDFCFFGSRMGVGDNRETKYIVKGSNEGSATLNTSGNSNKTVCVNKIKPDSDGTITLTVTSGENNNNGNGFFYISAMRMSQVQ